MEKTKVTERALRIASMVMVRAGMCRYESVDHCRRLYPGPGDCEKCLRSWLLTKARQELKKEGEI